MISELIKFCRVTLGGKDDKQYPVQQVSYMENTADAFVVFPYGMSANCLQESFGVLLAVNGDEQSLAALITSAVDRIKNLKEGEVIFYHPKTKSFMHYKNNGDIDIEAKGNLNVKAQAVNVDAPTATFTGALSCASLTIGGAPYAAHKHTNGTAGDGNTGGVV
jgi:phage gp45-like